MSSLKITILKTKAAKAVWDGPLTVEENVICPWKKRKFEIIRSSEFIGPRWPSPFLHGDFYVPEGLGAL